MRRDLRGLQKDTADSVARHLVAAGLLIDEDPLLALGHARFARKRASRIAVVREAAGIAAYHAGEWAEALGELRAARRMGAGPGHLAVMADAERALGRPERALELARGPEVKELGRAETIELMIVAAGARRDLGELDAAVVHLQIAELDPVRRDPWSPRLFYAYADNLLAAGRESDALQWFVHTVDADGDGETDASARIADLTGEAFPDDEADIVFGSEDADAPADDDLDAHPTGAPDGTLEATRPHNPAAEPTGSPDDGDAEPAGSAEPAGTGAPTDSAEPADKPEPVDLVGPVDAEPQAGDVDDVDDTAEPGDSAGVTAGSPAPTGAAASNDAAEPGDSDGDPEPSDVTGPEPDPAVVDPAVVDPAVVDPAVVDPAVVDPAVVEAVVDPAVVEAVVDPAVAEAVVDPAVVDPAVADPAVVDRADADHMVADRGGFDPPAARTDAEPESGLPAEGDPER